MKICFVDYDITVVGGAEQVSVALANAMIESFETYIFSINCENVNIPYQISDKVKVVFGEERKIRLREMIIGNFKSFVNFINHNKIDIIMMMGNYPALIVSVTRFFTKAKYIYCDHGALMNQWNQKDITLVRFWNAITAHKIVTLTQKNKNDYHEKFRVPYKKLDCIYNWVELPEMREYNALSKKIISVGRFGKEKGYDMLVDVAETVLRRNPEWVWDIYGSGELFEEIKEEVEKRGLEERLHLKGQSLKIKELYKEYAMLVLTSYREGMPLVLLEAKANTLPLISFDIETGPREIIRNKQDGYLIAPFDLAEMARKIEMLIKDDTLRIQFSDASIENIMSFSKETIFEQWIQLFKELTGDNDEKI